MPKRDRKRHRTMKGGFLETLSEWGSSLTQGASDLWRKTKDATTGMSSTSTYDSSSSTSSSPSYNQTPTYTSSPSITSTTMGYGGRRTKRRRHMKGGFKDNTPTTGLASNAASFSGTTAQPQTIVGGRTRRHRRKSRKHRKH